jgi:hypothetical protein
VLDNMERKSALIMTTKTGHAFKKRYFIKLWNDAMKAAGLDGVQLPGMDAPVELHFHDLRGLPGHAGLPNRRFSTLRTLREQNLQTNCKLEQM